ncbi:MULTISPECIES: hypothetical protein [Flagellimonas]|nr:hypothetical protein [Allomuricauda hadalis]
MGLKVPETLLFLEEELMDAPNQLTDAHYQLIDGFLMVREVIKAI